MNNVVEFRITATPETALKKLAKADVPVYKLKKNGVYLCFGVNEEYVEKVFAIFAHPCYNTRIRRKSKKMRFITFLKRRAGLFIGGAAFIALATVSGSFVFRIKVTGSGSYMKSEIISLAAECGAREWSTCSTLDKPLLQARIMALPGVNFCSVQRDGSFLIIDVQAENDNSSAVGYGPLKSSADGEVYKIVAVCGTAEKSAGDKVRAGDVLIGAYEVKEDGTRTECLAVGYAEIKRQANLSLFYDCESEENARDALSSTALYSDKILEKSYAVKQCEGGVTYEVCFTYLVTLAANMQ